MTAHCDICDNLIADIKEAVKSSRRNGAEYSVFRKNADGSYPVSISVQLNVYEYKRSIR